jgi:signal transduction histidine kinase
MFLSLAANLAAMAVQNAHLIHHRTKAEEEVRAARDELEVRVRERTAELHAANDALSALRHVATLVADGVQPHALFGVVAEEVARVVDVPLVSVVRYELDGTTTECASYSLDDVVVEAGEHWSLEGTNILQLVRESVAPARVDDHSPLVGGRADDGCSNEIRSTVGVPLVVGGRVWGAIVVSSTAKHDRLPKDTEARLADFSELLATAIENAQSREALAQLADEQATLRRMATLVAQGVPPEDIFSVVSAEAARLLGSDTAAVVRFEHDPPAIVVVGLGKAIPGIPIGTRTELDDGLASTAVYRTGRSGRVDARDSATTKGPIHEPARRQGLTATVASPIIVEGRLWGTMSVSAKEPLPLGIEERLEKLSELVATAISNAESKSALAASRRRIVAASDEARRRIERDLHDGTQQRLISLALAVHAAEAKVAPNSGLRPELSRIATGLADAVAELQELSRGIHPAILSQGGLGPALRTLARRSPIPVELDVAWDTRLTEPIEVAAYYVASEALANATKHAHASLVEVSLAAHNGRLVLSIGDDGVGGADPGRGSGLAGLKDRVEALGGSIHVQSRPGHGTQITADLPLGLEGDTSPVESIEPG